MSQVLLRTWVDDDAADINYEYQIVKSKNPKTEDEEFLVYQIISPLRYKVRGTYDYFMDAVKALHSHMEAGEFEE